MKRNFYFVFAIVFAIYCLNLLIYSNKLDEIKKNSSTLSTKLRSTTYYDENLVFKPKCACHNYSIHFSINVETNKYAVSKVFQNFSELHLYEITKDSLAQSVVTCDKFHAFKRGPFQKVISYSLYGQNKKYYRHIRKIVELASKYFPEWSIRIYHDSSIDEQIICELECFVNTNGHMVVDFCDVAELNLNLNGMYWRLMPIGKQKNIDLQYFSYTF